MKSISKRAVMCEQRKLLDRIEWNFRESVPASQRRLLGAEAEMRMHYCAGSGNGGELGAWPHKVQRPHNAFS